jgi:D-glycero-alpha-D-manno-heptose-7-phosphate kinase
MIIETSAPTRVDMAGGTIDIPPLYLLHEGAATINFAISYLAHCRIETRNDDKIIIESLDRNERLETSLSNLKSLRDETHLELPAKLIYFFKPQVGFNMTIKSEVPAGAGLAGSSTLNIACIAGLNYLVGNRYPPEKFIPIAAAIECQVIKVPTGYQDYYSAQYGGIAAIHFRPDGIEREALNVDVETLQNRIVIVYTGEPRNSGINNWEIVKRRIDGDKEIFRLLEGIRDTALNFRKALIESDWNLVGEILYQAHFERKKFFGSITTPYMDQVIEFALSNGAMAPKVCGAGGGGCIAFFCKEDAKSNLELALSKLHGVKVLSDWKIFTTGLSIKVT